MEGGCGPGPSCSRGHSCGLQNAPWQEGVSPCARGTAQEWAAGHREPLSKLHGTHFSHCPGDMQDPAFGGAEGIREGQGPPQVRLKQGQPAARTRDPFVLPQLLHKPGQSGLPWPLLVSEENSDWTAG